MEKKATTRKMSQKLAVQQTTEEEEDRKLPLKWFVNRQQQLNTATEL